MKSKQEVLQNFDERIHAFVRNVNKFDEPIVDVSAMADRIDALTRERDEAKKDTERLDWLEAAHTLHNSVEILYVANGYNVDIMHHDGATCHKSLHGATLREAMDFARTAQEDA